MHRRQLVLSLGTVALLVAAAPALAKDIVRHCDGEYRMVATLVDGRPPAGNLEWHFGDYAGRGHCGSSVPNRCRERARNKLETCYREHWKVRWDRVRPQACTESGGVSRYALADVKSTMEELVCCSDKASKHDEITVNLYGLSWGNRGCGADARPRLLGSLDEHGRSLLVQADYEMDCSELRRKFCRDRVPKRTNP